MKKILAVVLVGALSFSLVGCGREEDDRDDVSKLSTLTCTAVGCVWEDDECVVPEGFVWADDECIQK